MCVYTDCLSLLQALSTPKTLDAHVQTLKLLLRDISLRTTVLLFHIPGHSGVLGNELADFHAARAAQGGLLKRALLTSRGFRSMLRESESSRWAWEWTSENADTALFKWVPNASDIPAWFSPNKALVQFLTGHGRFYSYFRRFHLLPNPLCSCSLPFEGIEHYMYACSVTAPLAEHITPRTRVRGSNALPLTLAIRSQPRDFHLFGTHSERRNT